jgi:hypothetical protein
MSPREVGLGSAREALAEAWLAVLRALGQHLQTLSTATVTHTPRAPPLQSARASQAEGKGLRQAKPMEQKKAEMREHSGWRTAQACQGVQRTQMREEWQALPVENMGELVLISSSF